MSDELSELEKLLAKITLAEADGERHRTEQALRQLDVEFAVALSAAVRKVHPERVSLTLPVLMQVRQVLLDVCRRLEVRTQDAMILAEMIFQERTKPQAEPPSHSATEAGPQSPPEK